MFWAYLYLASSLGALAGIFSDRVFCGTHALDAWDAPDILISALLWPVVLGYALLKVNQPTGHGRGRR